MGNNGKYFEVLEIRLANTIKFPAGSDNLVIDVKVKVNGEIVHTASCLPGPVEAFEDALRQSLIPHFAILSKLNMENYRQIAHNVNQDGSHALVSTIVDFSFNGDRPQFESAPDRNKIKSGYMAVIMAYQESLALMLSRKEVVHG
jgi:hypothetical protein